MRLLVSFALALAILVVGYSVGWLLLPNVVVNGSVTLSIYTALLQAFATLFTIQGMFFIFKVQQLDLQIATGETDLGASMERIEGALRAREGAVPRVPRADPLGVLHYVKDSLHSRGGGIRDRVESWVVRSAAPHLTADAFAVITLKVEKDLITSRAKWPLSLVAVMTITNVGLIAITQILNLDHRANLMLLVSTSLFAVWVFMEVFLFTIQTLYRVGINERLVLKWLETHGVGEKQAAQEEKGKDEQQEERVTNAET